MNKHQIATFLSAGPLPPFWAVRFETPRPPAPGCFVLADLGGPVREALFPAALAPGEFTVLLPPGHPARHLLPGTEIDLLGPLGRGFRIGSEHRLLLIADALELPPLLPLTTAAPEVALIVRAPTRALLPPPERFPPSVELYLAVAGEEAPPLPALIRWADRVVAACRSDFYPELAGQVREERLQPTPDFAQALVRLPMPCGVGACDVCAVETRPGLRHACTDGPVFNLLDLI